MSRIFITGIGVISSIGKNVSENHSALKSSICGMSQLEYLKTNFANKMPFGEIKISTEKLKEDLKANEKGATRTDLLALYAFEEACADSALSQKELRSKDTTFVGASTVGGMCLMDEMYHDANQASKGSEYLSSYDFATPTLYLQQRFKLEGFINTINTACSSSANAIMLGARLIKQGKANRAIVGGTDSLSKFTINGFNSLGILSDQICTPFDNDRKGLNLGEGAAFLVLEKEENCEHKNVYAELSGYCNANDSFHPSSLSEQGDGPYAAMIGALTLSNIKKEELSFINAHGTATGNNDLVESGAMQRIFQNKMPDFASTKSNIGHTLGAAGAIEAVYSVLNIKHQEIYAGLNFKNPISEIGLFPVSHYQQKKIGHVLSNSFGFGGNCTSLLFSKI